jgi:hypothetical protein
MTKPSEEVFKCVCSFCWKEKFEINELSESEVGILPWRRVIASESKSGSLRLGWRVGTYQPTECATTLF